MNHLLFHLGEEQFAIAAKDIRAVLPVDEYPGGPAEV